MIITDYLVQSVLRTYNRLLRRSKLAESSTSNALEHDLNQEKITLSDEARRRLVLERMTSRAFEKAYPKR